MLHAFLKRPRHKRSFNLAEQLERQASSTIVDRGNGSLLSSNRLVLRLTDKMRYVQAVSLKRSYR